MIVFPPVAKIGKRDGAVLKIWLALVQCYQLIGLRIGQRIQQHCIDDREQSRVCAHSECDGDDHDRSEPGRLHKLAYGVTQILSKSIHGPNLLLVAQRFHWFDLRRTPGRQHGGCQRDYDHKHRHQAQRQRVAARDTV